MSERMSNAPVYYALAQARFNPVAAMATYIDQIQDSLRRDGYTLFERHEVAQLMMPSVPQEAPQIQRLVSWRIMRSDRTSGFIIDTSAITYHTTNYQTHNEFIPELLRGVSAVHEAVSLEHISRLGIRYLDAVLPRPGETVKDYLASGLSGIGLEAACQQHMTESVFTTKTSPLVENGILVVRTYHRTSSRWGLFPPDILQNGLVLPQKFAIDGEREHAIIDTDHYIQGQMSLDMHKLDEQLRSLRGAIKEAFFATVTDHACNVWK